ncbi:MAG TPA: PAS domain S-box protein [Pirellulaceae bacterium]|nr:PAS domain S-box protein [Pirellulaceae bacterium]
MTEALERSGSASESDLDRLLLENLRDVAIVTLDGDLRIRVWTAGAERLLGYSSAESLGRSVDRLFLSEGRAAGDPENEFRRATEQGRAETERWLVRKNGSRFWSHCTLTPLPDEQGVPAGFALIVRDRSDLKRTEEALASQTQEAEKQRRLYEASLSNTPDLVYVFDLQHRFTYANEVLLALWGRTWDEAIGKNCLELGYEPWHAAMHDREIEQVVATKQPIKGEVPFAGTFGRRHYEYIFVPVLDANGNVEAVAGTTRDVTDRKAAEEALERSERQSRAILESVADAFIAVDAEWRFTYVNARAEDVYGLSRESLLGRTLWDAFPDLIGHPFEQPFRRPMTDREPVRVEGPYAPLEGWFEVRIFPVDDGGLSFYFRDISEQQRAEDALRVSETRLRTLLDNLPYGAVYQVVAEADGSRRFDYVSAGIEGICGVAPEEALADPMALYGPIPEEDRAVVAAAEVESLRDLAPYNCEFGMRHKNGEVRRVHCRSAPRRTLGGSLVWEGVILDVTDRHRAEEAHRAAEARLTAVVDHSPATIFLKDAEGRYLLVNRQLEEQARAMGVAGSVVGRTDADLLPPEIAEVFRRDDLDVLQSGRARTYEESAVVAGELRTGLTTKFPLLDETGAAYAVGGISLDITDRVTADKRLRENQEWLRLAMEAGRMGTWDWDVQAGRLRWSENLESIHGLKRGEFDSTFESFQKLVHPEDLQALQSAVEQAMRDGTTYEAEFRIVRPDGSIGWMAGRGRAFYDGGGAPTRMVGVGMDVTDRRRAEDEVREGSRRKDEFLAMLAHELRNPLAPIRSGLDLLAMGGEESEIVEAMQQQVSHLVRLVDDLLDVSRIVRGRVELKRRAVELALIVRRAIETMLPQVDAQGQKLSTELPERAVWISADPVRLTQVISNLLHNASKYNDAGGRIDVAVSLAEGFATIRVRDTGIGIEPELLPRVFDLFTQASRSIDRSQGGLGIGLTVVKSLIEMHDGTVTAHSDGLGRGSEFVLRLPLCEAPEATAAGAPRAAARSTYKILVVDDNVAAAKMLARLLTKLGGHSVDLAHDGFAGIEAASKLSPDIVFLDLGLPKMDGFEVAKRLRETGACANALIVALTGYGTESDRSKSLQAGCDEHLVKPPEVGQLQEMLAHPKLTASRLT